jgi:hypothetical protein
VRLKGETVKNITRVGAYFVATAIIIAALACLAGKDTGKLGAGLTSSQGSLRSLNIDSALTIKQSAQVDVGGLGYENSTANKGGQFLYVYNITGESIPIGLPITTRFGISTIGILDTAVAFTALHGTPAADLTIADSGKTTGSDNSFRVTVYYSGTSATVPIYLWGYTPDGVKRKDTLTFQAEAISKYKVYARNYNKICSIVVGLHTDHDSICVMFGSGQFLNVRPEILASDTGVKGVAAEISKTRGRFKAYVPGVCYAKALVYADSTTGILCPGRPLITKATTGDFTPVIDRPAGHMICSPAIAIEPAHTRGLRLVLLKALN